jgi:hypothetical protein
MGFFSWITQDTNRPIHNAHSGRKPFTVIMADDKGNRYTEHEYDGYGDFGGKDYYALLDEMNGGVGSRERGIALAFDKEARQDGQRVIFPSLSECGDYYEGNEPASCPHQGFFYGEPSGPEVEVGDDSIHIYEGDQEIVMWDREEWEEDPSIVPAIANAIRLAYTDMDTLRNLIANKSHNA